MALSGLFTESAGSTRSITGEKAELFAKHGIRCGYSVGLPHDSKGQPNRDDPAQPNPIVMIRHEGLQKPAQPNRTDPA